MKSFKKYGGWVIDSLVMAFIIFITGIAITVYLVSANYILITLSFTLILAIIIPFMVYSHDESGAQESQVIALLMGIIRKLLSIPRPLQPKPEKIIARKTFLARKV